MANITPSWTDGVVVIASQALAKGSVAIGTLSLTSSVAAKVFVRIGRGGGTALSAPIQTFIRRLITAAGPIAAASSTTVGSDSASAQNTLHATSGSGFAADDYICIGGGTAREEW